MDAQKEAWRTEREMLQSQTQALQKELMTVKSKSNPKSKGTLANVARRLNMDDEEKEEYNEEIEAENLNQEDQENPEPSDRTENDNPTGGRDDGEKRDERHNKK